MRENANPLTNGTPPDPSAIERLRERYGSSGQPGLVSQQPIPLPTRSLSSRSAEEAPSPKSWASTMSSQSLSRQTSAASRQASGGAPSIVGSRQTSFELPTPMNFFESEDDDDPPTPERRLSVAEKVWIAAEESLVVLKDVRESSV